MMASGFKGLNQHCLIMMRVSSLHLTLDIHFATPKQSFPLLTSHITVFRHGKGWGRHPVLFSEHFIWVTRDATSESEVSWHRSAALQHPHMCRREGSVRSEPRHPRVCASGQLASSLNFYLST